MSMYDDIIAENPLTYFHQEEIPEDDESPADPLTRVVPSLSTDFFGPFVCNFLIFTRLYGDFDDVGAKAQLISTYSRFARYELHIYIDAEADAIASADSEDVDDLDERATELAGELSAYGVTYHGQLGGDQLKASVEEVIKAFNLFTAT